MQSFQFGSRFGSSCSRHPIPSVAVGEVVGDTLETVGQEPDLVLVAVTPDLAGTFDDIVGVVRSVLRPGALIATTATTVFSNDNAVSHRQGISLWAGRFGRAEPFHLPAPEDETEVSRHALEHLAERLDGHAATASTMILAADPFSFPCAEWSSIAGQRWPHLSVVGGSPSAVRRAGASRLASNTGTCRNAVVGAFTYAVPPPLTFMTPGAVMVGRAFRVTKAERNVVYELNHQDAKTSFDAVVQSLDLVQRDALRDAVYLGILRDAVESPESPESEPHESHEPSEWSESSERHPPGTRPGSAASDHSPEETQSEDSRPVLRQVIGFDRRTGALGLDAEVPEGSRVGFFARTVESIVEGLAEGLLTASEAHLVRASLLFTSCAQRDQIGIAAEHSADALFAMTQAPVGGFSCTNHFVTAGRHHGTSGVGSSVTLFR